jgi:predicted naringenin-chalcone synthase
MVFISDFEHIRPAFEMPQDEMLDWQARSHVAASTVELRAIVDRMCKVSCKKSNIGSRGVVVSDGQKPFVGGSFKQSSDFFYAYTDQVFTQFYDKPTPIPSDILHVTCTGYGSPNAAQKLLVRKGWAKQTKVTNIYHMGCMGAMPAIRVARGYLAAPENTLVDIVHTEICSLHFNPNQMEDEHLVGQSLFADGFIKYSMSASKGPKPSLRVIAMHEEIIPGTEELLKWECEDWGLKMTLSKKIPFVVSKNCPGFVETLALKAGLDPKKIIETALFAIHPGGPRIIDHCVKGLKLKESQVEVSRQVLFKYGNMSSATLPHVFECILKDNTISTNTYIIAISCGPGMTFSGIIMEKII